MICILSHFSGALCLRNNFQETYQRHVTQLRDFVWFYQLQLSRLLVNHLWIIIELPYKQEGIANILVSGSLESINNTVDNLTDLVDEKHNSLLEHLCRIRESPNIAESEDTHAFMAG